MSEVRPAGRIATWGRSSVPAPMTLLEQDVLAGRYSDGFGRALSGFLGEPIRVLNQFVAGHLYSVLVDGASAARSDVEPLPVSEESWQETVRPLAMRHLDRLRELHDAEPSDALTEAAGLFSAIVCAHHRLLLPARAAVSTFAEFVAANDHPRPGAALLALNAVLVGRHPLLDLADRIVALPSEVKAAEIAPCLETIGLTGAPDGDGYGLAEPGWLDDGGEYMARAHRLLRRFEVSASTVGHLQRRAFCRRAEAERRLKPIPTERRAEAAELLSRARCGMYLAEEHGPLLHPRYLAGLRRLALAHGTRLRACGLLGDPGDIFHLRLDELSAGRWSAGEVRRRRATYAASRDAPLPPANIRAEVPATCRPLAPDTLSRLEPVFGLLGGQPDRTSLRAAPAVPGLATGRLRVLRSQRDLDSVRPGDMALVPDAGPAWGLLAYGAAALLIEQGSPVGHAANFARELDVPCIVGAAGLADRLAPGQTVTVNGTTGEVSW